MHFFSQVASWFGQRTHWHGSNGIPTLFVHQVLLSFAVIGAALVVGGGVGLLLGHYRRGALVAVNSANAARAIPTLALLTLFAILPAISLTWNGFLASFLALVILAIPPILTNTYVGVREVDADVRRAAAGMGMSGGQVMLGVELPLALPVIATGVRVAAIEVVATSTLAAYVSYGDLGTYVIAGLDTNDTVEAFCGGLLVALTAAAVAVVFGRLQRLATPAPLRRAAPALVTAGTGKGGV
ncbi:MAG TPA: ABC transporter permease subunit [Acidimicrobiales bacterium]|nr:ABC transporter permease subunit [Acidimicrobiales bacterium]